MSQRRRGLFFLGVFAVFLFASLFVHFFHTEKGLRPDSSCPACHFQSTSLAVGLSLAIILPQLLLVEILPVSESHLESAAVFFDLVSRSPPSA
jgi:ABC-type Mn2+/Zn2+ transport system permease subunit